MRTREQIRERLKGQKGGFNFAASDLQIYLPEEVIDPKDVKDPPTVEEAQALIVSYLPFAFGKALDHRGLSANRSIQHMQNFAWLAERDDLLAFAEDDENYKNYGVPILKRFAREFGVSLPADIEAWEDGDACADCRVNNNGCEGRAGVIGPEDSTSTVH